MLGGNNPVADESTFIVVTADIIDDCDSPTQAHRAFPKESDESGSFADKQFYEVWHCERKRTNQNHPKNHLT